jgi:hypothetical protein
MITLVLYIGSLPNLTTWFPYGRGRTLFILGSLPLYRLIIYIDRRILWCTHFLLLLNLCSNVSRSLSDSLFFPSMDILIRGSKFLWVNLDLKRSFNQIHVWKAPLHRGSRGRDEVCMLLEKSVIKPFLQSWYKL